MQEDLGLKQGGIIQDYRLLEFINSGSTADIWKVEDLARQVKALKIYSPVKTDQPFTMDVLFEEFKLTIPLEHPNILKPEKIGVYKNVPYIIMPFCNGSLADEITRRHIQKKNLAVTATELFTNIECANLLHEVALGLQYLHEHNIIHQDVKPENILVIDKPDGPQYVISDFGISYQRPKGTSGNFSTVSDSIQLTPAYAAPEQLIGRVEKASDIFSLGVIGFEMMEGGLPFESNQPTAEALQRGESIPFFKSNISSRLRALILKCMSIDPISRPDIQEILLATKSIMEFPEESPNADIERRERKTEIFRSGYEENVQNDYAESATIRSNKFSADERIYSSKSSGHQGRVVHPGKQKNTKIILVSLSVIGICLISWFGYQKIQTRKAALAHQEALSAFYAGEINKAEEIWSTSANKFSEARRYLNTCTTLVKNLNGKQLDGIRPFSHDRAAIKEKGKELWGFIDTLGHIIAPIEYKEVMDFMPTSMVTAACRNRDNQCGFLSLNGTEHSFDFVRCKYLDGNKWEVESQMGNHRTVSTITPLSTN